VRFEPLRPVSRGRLILRLVYGPVLWLAAFTVVAWLFVSSRVIQAGLLVTVASFLIGLLVLAILRMGRRREERRYVAGD
jgi:divalent metal cation (Fe/Co/Zn/Cd) transporter